MKAPHFDLLGVDGRRYSPVTARGDNGNTQLAELLSRTLPARK